jgi:hypothetical protein
MDTLPYPEDTKLYNGRRYAGPEIPEMSIQIGTDTAAAWRPSACILCECNCGILVRLGGDNGRRFEQIRGDKAHPASKGYTCQKALRLDHYQNGRGERVLEPLRRRADGSFETIDWPTAIGEVTARLHSVRETYGGETILYYGGGGQGNHLGGFYSAATLRAFGAKFRSSAIEQEKTGEAWVNGLMFGTPVRGEFEHCEVALFIGKNPWQSHSFPHARLTLRNIAKDPARSMIVIDPRRTETAELADIHLRVRPGRDAWLLAALAAVLVDENLTNSVAHRACLGGRGRRGSAGDRADRRVLPDQRGRRGPGAGRRAPHRSSVERGGVRGSWRADEPALDARELSGKARVGPDGQSGSARRPVRPSFAPARPSSILARRRSARWSGRGSSAGSSPATSFPTRSSRITRGATGR